MKYQVGSIHYEVIPYASFENSLLKVEKNDNKMIRCIYAFPLYSIFQIEETILCYCYSYVIFCIGLRAAKYYKR